MDPEKEKQSKKRKATVRRAYYSELATNLDYSGENEERLTGVFKRTKLLWQVKTEKQAPIVHKLPRPTRPSFLAPAERWMCYEEEKQICFPVDTFKPKVQMQHEGEPMVLPRNVAIERRRRQYQGQSIKRCLDELGIEGQQILPAHIVQKKTTEDKFGLYSKVNYLPLELFDDEEYDSRTPQSWLNHGLLEGVRHPIPGEAFLPISAKSQVPENPPDPLNYIYEWVNVAVIDYSPEGKLWHVLTLDGLQRAFKVPRIYLMFKAEDPMVFENRIKAAIELRNITENNIRYEFYLDCMLLTGTYDIDENCLDKIYNLATRNKTMKIDDPENLEKLEYEVRLNHKRTLGEMQFRYSAEKQPHVYKFLTLPSREVQKVPEQGRVFTAMEDFEGMRNYFRWMSIWVIAETSRAMAIVAWQCIEVSQMSLFTTSYGKFVTLDEFHAAQVHITDNTVKYLKGVWLDKISRNIKMCLGDIGKGWFNVNEKKHDIYDSAKLIRFMELVKYRMQYALRLLVENSTTMFVNLVEVPCQCCLDLEDDFTWGSDLINSPFRPVTQPIFNLLLKMDPEYGAFYSTNPNEFAPNLLGLYDTAIRVTHTINQIHPMLLGYLKFPVDLYLSSVGLLDKDVCALRERMLRGYEKAIIPLKAYAAEYIVHLPLYTLDVAAFITEYKEEQHTAAEYKEDIIYQLKMKENLEVTLPLVISIGPFVINTEPLKTFLVNKRQDIANKMLDQFCGIMKFNMEEVLQEYKFLMIRLNEKPHSIEHIYEIRDWMETIPMTIRAQEELTKKYLLEYEVLDYFWYALPQEDFENKWEAIGWPYKIAQQIDNTNLFLEDEFDKYLKIQMNDELTLEEKIEHLTVLVTQMSGLRDFSKTHEIAVDIRRVWKAMKEAQEQGQLLNSRQKLFLVPVTPYDTLTKLIKEFEPYRNLWITASDWLKWHEIWMDNPLVNVDGEAIEGVVSDMYKTMLKSMRIFAEIEAVQNVAIEIKNQIEDFRPLIPLIQNLRSPGMRQRHWDALKEETGVNVVWTPTITFNDFLDLGIEKYGEAIVKVGENSAKEYSIEQTLDKMESEWENNMMELTLYKSTGTYIMKVADDIQQMLDDHIVMTQQISFSPYKTAFEARIDEWEEKLRVSSEVLEEWMEVQKQWMYLEPIFTSEDISRQLPVESKKYNTMERTWRRIMRNAFDCPTILLTCPDKKLLESLRDCNHLLEVVQKGLTDYLETKRTVFPRLFFLSDDELLEILSQARNPLAVQPHLRKCFENIARLTFEADLQITQMWSAEDECIDLRPTLYPTGNVENWLAVVEETMKNTVRLSLGESLQDMAGTERTTWVLRWPGQIVIAGCQTYWTTGVENSLVVNKLPAFFAVVLSNLDELRGLVRGSLTFLQREILSALIVIEVHARDVTQNMVDNKVCNVNDFDWISQLRYYWVEEQMYVRAVNAEFPYGYEYLGNSGRLVITPLTDRCYLTLTGALHLKFGGAPAGPAGTGKTETTKDLAKAFAIQCVVFNCSDQLDFMAMGKFLKGLASSGAWACFDEFNRIDIEVLSVVAQQIMTIQKAQQARLDRFMFEGSEIVLKQSCAVFITMNPGYAGRTELPDNLKALFRPVAMMVPDYTLIAEISLFSFGFGNAKQLANKITTTFKLSSEQLSSQDHYDFGMRAVKTVIAVAGNLKREKPTMEERQIVLRALMDVNVPKFLKDDLKLFYGIVSDLFPRMAEEPVDYGLLEQSIRSTCIKHGLEDVDDYVKKVIQLYETTVVRHGLMLVGPTGSGKTKMPRKYVAKDGVKKRIPPDPSIVAKAVDAVNAGETYKGTAKRFGLNLMTLKRICKKGEKRLPGYQNRLVFSKSEEKELGAFLQSMSSMYYGLTLVQLRELAYSYAVANKKKYPKSWDEKKEAGRDWYKGFLERNKNLSLRTPEPTSLARSSAFNRHTIGEFFGKLADVYGRYTFPPECISSEIDRATVGSPAPVSTAFSSDATTVDVLSSTSTPPLHAVSFVPAPGYSDSSLATTPKSKPLKQQHFSPQDIMPFPKAAPRVQSNRGRKRGRCRILTDTPEKTQIEQHNEMMIAKKFKKVSEKVVKVRKTILESSSDEEDLPNLPDSSGASDFDSESDKEDSNLKEPELNDFVLVRFATKKTVKCYVGQIIEQNSNVFKVNFLRRKGTSGGFSFPPVKDVSEVDRDDIVKTLPQPCTAHTARTAGIYKFPTKFDTNVN